MKTGVFTGSFDPYTIGHDNIVRRMLPLFDRIVIGVVETNVHKQGQTPAVERCANIARVYAQEPKIEVKVYKDLAVDLAHREQAQYIIKGIRSVKDFEYEREIDSISRRRRQQARQHIRKISRMPARSVQQDTCKG